MRTYDWQYSRKNKSAKSDERVTKTNRVEPKFVIGNKYFISFEKNVALPCSLVEVINEFSRTEVQKQL